MQGLGYREFVRVVQERLDVEEARRLMQRDTLRYARRQWTWFAREPELQWIDVEAAEAAGGVAAAIEASLKQEGRIGGDNGGETVGTAARDAATREGACARIGCWRRCVGPSRGG